MNRELKRIIKYVLKNTSPVHYQKALKILSTNNLDKLVTLLREFQYEADDITMSAKWDLRPSSPKTEERDNGTLFAKRCLGKALGLISSAFEIFFGITIYAEKYKYDQESDRKFIWHYINFMGYQASGFIREMLFWQTNPLKSLSPKSIPNQAKKECVKGENEYKKVFHFEP